MNYKTTAAEVKTVAFAASTNNIIFYPNNKNNMDYQKITEAMVSEFINNRSFEDITLDTSSEAYDNAPLQEDRIYHLNMMGGLKFYWIKNNRRTFKRALKMHKACTENGMTTPAIVVDAKVVSQWGIPMIDPATLETIPEEQFEGAYCLMEGHGRSHAHLVDLALASQEENHKPFDFHFIYKKYDNGDEFGKAYVSTNADMTRTTNKDRLGIAGARCQNPLVKSCLNKISEDHAIAKAAYFWTYGRELTKQEVTAITYDTAEAPKFDPAMTESLQRVYDAFKNRFANPGAEKIYRGVAAAQWVAVQLKNPSTASVMADSIITKVKNLNEGVYTALITAKSNAKKHITKDQVIKTELDKMMK